MSTSTWNFRKTDVKRAVLAARQAGAHVAKIEIDPGSGRITLLTVDREATERPAKPADSPKAA